MRYPRILAYTNRWESVSLGEFRLEQEGGETQVDLSCQPCGGWVLGKKFGIGNQEPTSSACYEGGRTGPNQRTLKLRFLRLQFNS